MPSAGLWPVILVTITLCVLNPAQGVSSDDIVSNHNVEIDPEAPFPSVMFSDILKSMSDQAVWESGQLRFFERVRLTFLPEFNDPQNIAAYNPNTGAFIVTELKGGNDASETTIFWEARQESFPYWNASVRNHSDPAPLAPGQYSLTWKVDGTAFWSMDFEVASQASKNAYDKPNTYLEGPWEDWAYIYVPNGNLNQAPTFNFFLRDKLANPGNWIEKNIIVSIERDGTLVAQYGHEGHSRQMAKPWWEAHELALRSADNSGFASAKDIVAPGKYQVIVKNGDELMAIFDYEADGEIPFTGLQDRENADPMAYLEGARDRFYISRK